MSVLAHKKSYSASVEDVAEASAWVAQNADHVKINAAKIPEYARFILSKYPVVTEMSHDHYVSNNAEKTAAYILALDSINFGSGYFHIAREWGIELEYATIAGGLKKAFEQGMLSHPADWLDVTADDMSALLSVPQGAHPQLDKLLARFAQHLRGTGERVVADYQGKVLNLLEVADYSALNLAEIVSGWKDFRDIHSYQGREIPFFKRAQILAADMHLALGGLKDMDALTIFADNMVPHVLRCDDILVYEDALAKKIDSGTLLPSGSEEEIEIRACAIHAVELMKSHLTLPPWGRVRERASITAPSPLPSPPPKGEGVTSVNLDHMLWHRGYEPELYSKPSHRTLTADY